MLTFSEFLGCLYEATATAAERREQNYTKVDLMTIYNRRERRQAGNIEDANQPTVGVVLNNEPRAD